MLSILQSLRVYSRDINTVIHDRFLGQPKRVVELVTIEVHNRDPCKCRFLVKLGPHCNHFALNRDTSSCIRSLSLKLAIQVLLYEVLP